MTGQPAPIGAMRAALDAAVDAALSRPWRCPGRCCSAPPCCSPSRRAVARRRRRPADRPGRRRPAGPAARGPSSTAVFAAAPASAPCCSPGCGRPPSPSRWAAGAAVVLGAVDLASHRLPDRVTYPARRRLRGRAAGRRRRARTVAACCAPSLAGGRRVRASRRGRGGRPGGPGLRRRQAARAARPPARLVRAGASCWPGCSSACSTGALVSLDAAGHPPGRLAHRDPVRSAADRRRRGALALAVLGCGPPGPA